MFHDDLTIIIQGKLNPRSLSNLDNYLSFGKVIISCWANDHPQLIGSLPFEKIDLIVSKVPDTTGYYGSNTYYQFYSTYQGLKLCQTPYCLKVRSDEFYTNLEPIIAKIKNSPEKLITNNFLFRPDAIRKYHISDHIIGGTCHHMLGTFELAKKRIETNHLGVEYFPQYSDVCTEFIIATSFLQFKKVVFGLDNSKEIMKQHFDLVRVSELGNFLCAWNTNKAHAGSAYTQENLPYEWMIRSMDEL